MRSKNNEWNIHSYPNNIYFEKYVGKEEVYGAISELVRSVDICGTYYHFCGFPDTKWNESGMADRARREIVPVKVSRRLRTEGLYYPADWILEKFGGEIARREYRNYKLLPDGLEIHSRFYIYGSSVLNIFENGEDFEAVRVWNKEYAQRYQKIFHQMCRGFPDYKMTNEVRFDYCAAELIKTAAVHCLLESVSSGFRVINIDDKRIAKEMRKILDRSRGLEVVINEVGEDCSERE